MKKALLVLLLAHLLTGCFITARIQGDGRIASTGGHDCGAGTTGVCTVEYIEDDTEIFTATAASGSMLSKWNACDFATLDTCTTTWSQDMARNGVLGNDTMVVEATFKERDPPVQSAQYTYNALGQRMTKKVGGQTTIFQYDMEGNLIGEYNAAGEPLRQHIHVNGKPIAQLSTTIGGGISVQYIHTDHLGTPILLTDQTGIVVADIEATPFGDTHIDYVEVTHNRRFPGQYKDEESGLHYNYFRDYDPSLGRYIQSDPIGLVGGLNTYTYTSANPINRYDFFGLYWFRPPGHPYPVGRERDPWVSPGYEDSNPIVHGGYLDDYLPAGHTFGTYHDAVHEYLTEELGLPELMANIPTMGVSYYAAFLRELYNSLGIPNPFPDPENLHECE